MRSLLVGLVLVVMAVLVVGIAIKLAPPRSRGEAEVRRPEDLDDFNVLYRQNCSGCHGVNGAGGAAPALADPTYLAIADAPAIRHAATFGVRGTPMPAFAQSAGGMLTDKQIDILVNGIRGWAKPDALHGLTAPPYSEKEAGDAARGARAYASYCAACHGANGAGGPKGSSIVDGSFLALISDQGLRTAVIVGRPDKGFPDWHDDVPGKPMTTQDVSDVVAWLSAQRPKVPGQPYPQTSSQPAAGSVGAGAAQ